MPKVITNANRSPYVAGDSTRGWIESIGRKQGFISPTVFLRVATDTSHIRDVVRSLYDTPKSVQTKAIMNNALPGMRVPNILSWNVTESVDQITQSAQLECLNAHTLTNITTTVANVAPDNPFNKPGYLDRSLADRFHSTSITGSWALDSLFVVQKVTGSGGINSNGNKRVEDVKDQRGYNFQESNVKYRTFADQTFTVADASQFPTPVIPDDDDNDVKLDSAWPYGGGTGSYFILVDQEVMRVTNLTGNKFAVPAGGRAINGILQDHQVGEKVTLLNFGNQPQGEWTAMGYLNVDDYRPQTAILRPGTILVSYEGYGDLPYLLSHEYNSSQNYQFTGYWIVESAESSIGDDGVPRIRFDLKSAGYMFEGPKINKDTILRMKNQFGQWDVKGKTIWQSAGATRNIPGDWVDFNKWDPSKVGSYPLQIKTHYAQQKAFFDHMQDTQGGLRCIECRAELAEYMKTHKTETAVNRPVGRHVYQESIRVLDDPNGGPVKTYIRLMATMAAAVWDHPAYGTEVSQKFSKIPNKLFDSIRNVVGTGLCYNGQLDFDFVNADPDYDWTNPTYDSRHIIGRRRDLTCPFESTYDNAPWSQPMLDLADINGSTFWVDRKGRPVFKPRTMNMRPFNKGGIWYMSYGASISTYTHSVSPQDVVTQVWVTANGPFAEQATFTVPASGTGYDANGNLTFYSPVAGNTQGLALTSGVQQVDTITLDNMMLGLDWNTRPANWGLKERLPAGGTTQLNAKPPYYDGNPTLTKKKGQNTNAVKRVQQLINFFLVRGYINPIVISGNADKTVNGTWFTINEDGTYGEVTFQGVRAIQAAMGITVDGNYGRQTALAWFDNRHTPATGYSETHKYYIQTDIWWYYRNGKTWDEYVATMLGIPVPLRGAIKPLKNHQDYGPDNNGYLINDIGLQKEVVKWLKGFAKQVVNIGNRRVDDSINKATVRSISSNLADPRIMPGDTIWCEIPGHLESTSPTGGAKPPFTNGIYVTQISRSFDMQAGTYTATYSGPRVRGDFGKSLAGGVNTKTEWV